MLLVFDVKVVVYFFLFYFRMIGVSVLWLELSLPLVNFTVLITNQLDQAFILINEMCILGEQKFNFIFQIVVILGPFDLVKKFLVYGNQLRLQLPASGPPDISLAVGVG